MIKPTVGRVVWYWAAKPESPEEQPMAAMVTRVLSDTCVNLVVFDYNGNPSGHLDVQLYQGEAEVPPSRYCQWMPYQVGQAKAAEAAKNA